jgi:hypothetical protein
VLDVRSALVDFYPPRTFPIKCGVCKDSASVAGLQIRGKVSVYDPLFF